jgi:hypothetical protein
MTILICSRGDRGYVGHFFSLRCQFFKYKNLKKKNIGVIPMHFSTLGFFATYAHQLKTYLCLDFFKVTDKALS